MDAVDYRKTRMTGCLIGRVIALVSMPPLTQREPALDGIRGLAVMLTFCVHFAGSYLAKFRGANPDQVPMSGWTEFFDKFLFWLYDSHHGVHFFFTLSGFLIARLVLKSKRFTYWPFFRKRLKRIYPPFLFSLTICIALPMLIFGRAAPSIGQVIGNLFFLNALPQTGIIGLAFNNVTWSLFFEFVYYLSFPVMMLIIRRFDISPVFGLIVGGLALTFLPFFAGVFQTEVFLLFFAGAFVGLMSSDDGRRLASRIPDSVLVVFYFAVTTMHTFGVIDGGRFLWVFAVAAAIVVLKSAYGDGWLTRIFSVRPLVWLGEISFSFYLMHSIAIALVFGAAPSRIPVSFSSRAPVFHFLGLAVIAFAGALAIAALSFALFERSYFGEKRTHLKIGSGSA